MITVQGYIDGVSYAVTLNQGGEEGAVGVASGSPSALAVLDLAQGQTIEVTPVGPFLPGGAGTVESALATLSARTEVTSVETDDGSEVPDPAGRPLPGVAY